MGDCKIRECKQAVLAEDLHAKVFCDKSNAIGDCATDHKVENYGQIITADANLAPTGDGLHAGDRVELHSLQAKPEYNGKSGILLAFNVESGRWQINLDVGGSLYESSESDQGSSL